MDPKTKNRLVGAALGISALMGAGGLVRGSSASLFGTQWFGAWGFDTESAQDKTFIAGDACAYLDPLKPAPVEGEHVGVASYAQVDYAGDASGVDCEAGQCIADIRTWFPGTLRAGRFCRGDGVCAALQQDGYVPPGGPMSSTTSSAVWWDAGGTIATQVCCGSPCYAVASTSVLGGMPRAWGSSSSSSSGGSSSGSSSGGSSSGSSSGGSSSGGPPPNPATCCGAGNPIVAYYEGSSLNHVSTTVTTWTDLSGNGNTMTASGSPVYNASGSTPTPQPTLSTNGSNWVERDTVTWGSAANAWNECVVAKSADTGTVSLAGATDNSAGTMEFLIPGTQIPQFDNNAGGWSAWGSAAIDGAWHVYCGGTTGATTGSSFIEVDNAAPVTTTISLGGTSTAGIANIAIGAREFGGIGITAEIAAVAICAGTSVLDGTQLTCLQAWYVSQYGAL